MHLSRNASLAAHLALKAIALSDTAGYAEFRSSEHVESGMSTGGRLSSATVPNDPSSYRACSRTRVETAAIDAILSRDELPAPDVLKIDVEGAEAAVLRGGREVIQARRPVLILIADTHRPVCFNVLSVRTLRTRRSSREQYMRLQARYPACQTLSKG
jgi:FkbM family methyltransferase